MMWPANKYISKRAFPMAAIRAAVDRTKLPCFSFLTGKGVKPFTIQFPRSCLDCRYCIVDELRDRATRYCVKLLVCQLAYLTITYASGMVALIHEDLFSIISATGSSDRS
jgi:hypothetical protein